MRAQAGPLGARWRGATAGGPAGNELLTAATAVALLLLLAAEGVTILRLSSLLWVHLFVGMALVPLVALKLASTGWRFVRYYTGHADYVLKGPPELVLRMIAPLVVASTIIVLATGTGLLIVGPGSRDTLLPVHKISFFIWLAATAVHVLGHLPGLPRAVRADYAGGGVRRPEPTAGVLARRAALALSLAAGLAVALLLLPDFAPWLHRTVAEGR